MKETHEEFWYTTSNSIFIYYSPSHIDFNVGVIILQVNLSSTASEAQIRCYPS